MQYGTMLAGRAGFTRLFRDDRVLLTGRLRSAGRDGRACIHW